VLNGLQGLSGEWGVDPWYYYFVLLVAYWTVPFAVMMAVLAYLGALREKRIALAGLAVLLVHSLVGHKEYRFIYPAILLLVISAGIGAGNLLERVSRNTKPFLLALPALVVIVLIPVVLLRSVSYRELFARDDAVMETSIEASKLNNVCGIELSGIPWFWSGGYTLIHQNAPIYWFAAGNDLAAHQDAFNTVIALGDVPEHFEKKTCFGAICLAQRAGSCVPLAMQPTEIPAGIPAGMTPELKP